MPLSGSCDICGKLSHALSICVFCEARVCVNCLDPRTGSCTRCQARIMRK